MVPDDVMVPVLLNTFVVVRMPVGPIVMVPELITGPLLVMVPKSVMRPILLRVTVDAMISVLPELIVKVETVQVEVAAVQVPPSDWHEAWSCSVMIPGVTGAVVVTVLVIMEVELVAVDLVVLVVVTPVAVIVSRGPVVTAPLDKILPLMLTVVPTVIAALVNTFPAKTLFAPRVTAPTGTQKILAGFAFAN